MPPDLPAGKGPRVLALHLPDLPLQRVLRGRGNGGLAAVVAEGVVLCCTPAVRAAGARPGDSPVQTRAACGQLEEIALDSEADRAALRGLAEALLALAPAAEISPPDTLLLDASAAHLAPGRSGVHPEVRLAERAADLARDLGWRCRVAVASGRGPARALARHGSRPLAWVPPPQTAQALAPLPLAALDLPAQACERLRAVGVADVGVLARLPVEALSHRFGAAGAAASRLARGEDSSRLVPYLPEALPEESFELDGPVESADPLLFVAKRLADRVAARLVGRGLGATRLELTLALERRGAEKLALPLARPSASAAGWLLVIRERLWSMRLPAPVAGLRLAALEAAAAPREQLAFGDRPEAAAALEAVLARLAARLGESAVFAAESADRHRPEVAYRPAPFLQERERAGRSPRPGRKERRATPAAAAASPSPVAPADLVRPTRLLAPPRPVVAEGEGGRLTALRLGERAYPVLAFAGPERLCGEWWNEPFDRDYYRVRLGGLGDAWIFRDGGDGRLYLHGLFD